MTQPIELDALNSTWSVGSPGSTGTITIGGDGILFVPDGQVHTHDDSVKSIVMTPRMDQGLFERFRSLFKSSLKPGVHVARKDGLRHMFIITSNSYEDRENETITSEALKAYEASCYPGEDLFHCDNPLLWWHDDDVVMGEIVAVNYVEPFLIEVARELPTAVSKVLFDYAEQNEDNAGASHRFGYLEKDRDTDGTFHRIFKQETTYLPERDLAANERTYAGVMMSSPQSDKRLDEIFEKAAGIKGASAMLHAKSGELEQKLSALGVQHKAQKPGMPPIEADAVEVEAEVESPVEETKEDIGSFAALVNQIYQLVMQIVDAQTGGMESEMAMAKALDEVKAQIKSMDDKRTSEKAYTATLEQRIEILEKRLSLQPRSVTQDKGFGSTEAAKEAVNAALDVVDKSKEQENIVIDPIWGPLKKL